MNNFEWRLRTGMTLLNETQHWTLQSLHTAAQVEVNIFRATNRKDIEDFFKIIEYNSGLCLNVLRAFEREVVG